ncbi:PrsW family glutamic-type intramembrane protease [Streptomyces axinellae]
MAARSSGQDDGPGNGPSGPHAPLGPGGPGGTGNPGSPSGSAGHLAPGPPPDAPGAWPYGAGPAHPTPSWWQRHQRTLRGAALIVLLALCGLMILALVREQTGTQGLLVGFGLALFPVPLLLTAFRWLSATLPAPWRTHLFAFAWGACAATLVAILANGFATDWLASSVVVDSPKEADTLGSTVIAPIVEESTKAVAIVLLFLFRRRHLDSVVSGIAAAGITATGFAFTENILYLGTAYGEDSLLDPQSLSGSATAATFFIRIVLAPFAHPLFTSFTGIAFGMVAAMPRRRRVLRWVVPCVGLFTAALLHAIWNGSASFQNLTFIAVYALFMIPVFAALTWLAIWSRQHELKVVHTTLSAYAAAGWFSEPEPWALSSMRARSMARAMARRSHGPEAARTLAGYQHDATALALLRSRADNGATAPDFAAREHALLQRLRTARPLAAPPTTSAALSLSRPAAPTWGAAARGPSGPHGYPGAHGRPGATGHPGAPGRPVAPGHQVGVPPQGYWGR